MTKLIITFLNFAKEPKSYDLLIIIIHVELMDYNALAQHVLGIFRSARPYITAYGFQHLVCWLVSWESGKQAVCAV